jgi:DNA topoisomerase-3
VFEAEEAYVCEQSQADTRPCSFKINKAVLQQPINRTQAARLLKDRTTDLLPKFISTKTGRTFDAYLVMNDAGKVTFEFPERGASAGPGQESS